MALSFDLWCRCLNWFLLLRLLYLAQHGDLTPSAHCRRRWPHSYASSLMTARTPTLRLHRNHHNRRRHKTCPSSPGSRRTAISFRPKINPLRPTILTKSSLGPCLSARTAKSPQAANNSRQKSTGERTEKAHRIRQSRTLIWPLPYAINHIPTHIKS
jgi:hypothetical protein